MNTGMLDVLNVGSGHLSISFDKADDADMERAKGIVEDMLRRGYGVFAETKDGIEKVLAFDRDKEAYLVGDTISDTQRADDKKKRRRPGKGRAVMALPMRTTKVTGVGRTAGG